MSAILYNLIDWAEVWALIIPLVFIFPAGKLKRWQKPVVIYLILAFFLNLIATLIADSDLIPFLIPWKNNIIFYNLHSVIRFICFSYFFICIPQQSYSKIKKLIPIVYILFLIIDVAFFENFFDSHKIAANLFTGEAFLLLVYCLLFYLSKLKTDNDEIIWGPEIYVVTGLSIFVVTNFFLYLFYDAMLAESLALANNIWTVHNVAYILFCVFIAKAFSKARRRFGDNSIPKVSS